MTQAALLQAEFVRTLRDNIDVTQRLYRLAVAVNYCYSYDDEGEPLYGSTNYVVVSHAHNAFARETMVFPATAEGTILNWLELAVNFAPEDDAPVLAKLGFRTTPVRQFDPTDQDPT